MLTLIYLFLVYVIAPVIEWCDNNNILGGKFYG